MQLMDRADAVSTALAAGFVLDAWPTFAAAANEAAGNETTTVTHYRRTVPMLGMDVVAVFELSGNTGPQGYCGVRQPVQGLAEQLFALEHNDFFTNDKHECQTRQNIAILWCDTWYFVKVKFEMTLCPVEPPPPSCSWCS